MGGGTQGYAARASWLEVDLDALEANIASLRSAVAPAGLAAVLKADAYGHGLLALLPGVHPHVAAIDVITPEDALAVRAWEEAARVEARPVLVLGVVTPEDAVALADAGVDVALGDDGWRDWVPALRRGRRCLRVHVHLDTGLGREGFRPEDLPEALADLPRAADVLQVVGVMTHFADTEDVTEQAYALAQLDGMERGAEALRVLLGDRPLVRHAAASAAGLVLAESRLDLVRAGIALYGLWPSRETRISARVVGSPVRLQPVLSWRVRPQHVKWLPAGAYVGYGCTWRCAEPSRVAVLPVGYFDGYPRALSGRAHVLCAGVRCAVLGRVMMNHIVVDLTHAPLVDDPVLTLLGRDGGEEVSADDLAGWAGTINYEITARLGAHLPRVRVGGGSPAGGGAAR